MERLDSLSIFSKKLDNLEFPEFSIKNFDKEGNETAMDYYRILKIVKEVGYTGYIGIEYEGRELGEVEGVLATKKLLIKAGKGL